MKLKNIFIASAMAFSLMSAAQAQVTVPHTFTTGSPAVADEVNANFNALATGINSNTDSIANLSTLITTLTARVDTLEANSGSLSNSAAGVYRLVSTYSEFFGENNDPHGYAAANNYVLVGRLEMNGDGTWSLAGNEFEHRLESIGDYHIDTVETSPGSGTFTSVFSGSQALDIQMAPLAVNESGTWTQTDTTVTLSLGGQAIVDFRISVGGDIMLAANTALEAVSVYNGAQAGVAIAIRTADLP